MTKEADRQAAEQPAVELGLGTVREALKAGAFRKLELQAYAYLARETHLSEQDRELIGQFWSVAMREPASFWRHVERRCDTNESVCAYLLRAFRNHVAKTRCPFEGEPVWLRARVRFLLRTNAGPVFAAEKQGRNPVYGLAVWQETFAALGVYAGDWLEFEAACRRFPPFQRRPVSERKGPYADEDLLEGLQRLLGIVMQYAAGYVLSHGLEQYWAACTNFCVTAFADPSAMDRQMAPDSPLLMEIDEIVARAVGELSERQRRVLLGYTIPRFCERKAAEKATLHDTAKELGVSHQTVANEEKRALAALREAFQLQEPSVDELQLWCRRLLDTYGA
ncbi:MAG: hypothetical protein JXR37_09835 [Kiritimatiellae bacterium]|nr:hypothetical protein [Kiritimatiellia bacterium]